MKLNKKAMSIPIVLLVILTLILVTVNITYFILREGGIQKTINVPSAMDSLYVKEAQINYRLQDVFDKATEDFKVKEGKEVFIENFKTELGKYKRDWDFIVVLDDVESQLTEDNINLTNKSLVLKLDIQLGMTHLIKGREVLDINYFYIKKFEKIFKVESV